MLADTIDLAVHSLKDLPTELDVRFVIAAVTERVDPRDVFVSTRFESMGELPAGARVGTSSLRRQSQLRARWPQLEYVDFRGNVDTRLRKLVKGRWRRQCWRLRDWTGWSARSGCESDFRRMCCVLRRGRGRWPSSAGPGMSARARCWRAWTCRVALCSDGGASGAGRAGRRMPGADWGLLQA